MLTRSIILTGGFLLTRNDILTMGSLKFLLTAFNTRLEHKRRCGLKILKNFLLRLDKLFRKCYIKVVSNNNKIKGDTLIWN